MNTLPPSWPEIFELWKDPARPSEKQLAIRLANDMGHPSFEAVRQWRARNFIPVWHWPKLIEALRESFGIEASYGDLVARTCKAYASRREAA